MFIFYREHNVYNDSSKYILRTDEFQKDRCRQKSRLSKYYGS